MLSRGNPSLGSVSQNFVSRANPVGAYHSQDAVVKYETLVAAAQLEQQGSDYRYHFGYGG
jgi:hypothetical protein